MKENTKALECFQFHHTVAEKIGKVTISLDLSKTLSHTSQSYSHNVGPKSDTQLLLFPQVT